MSAVLSSPSTSTTISVGDWSAIRTVARSTLGNSTHLMSLRQEKGYGTGVDIALVFGISGVTVSNLIQLYMSGDFKLNLQNGGETPTPIETALTIKHAAVLLAQMKWNLDRRTILLIRALGGILLLTAMCVRSNVSTAVFILIAGAMLITTCNLLHFIIELAYNPQFFNNYFNDQDGKAVSGFGGFGRVFVFLARVTYVISGWPCLLIALCLAYNLNADKMDSWEHEDVERAISATASLIMAGTLSILFAAIVFVWQTPFMKDPFDGIEVKDGMTLGYDYDPKYGTIRVRADPAEGLLP